MNWRHIFKHFVISHDDYSKLPLQKQSHYVPSHLEHTHQYVNHEEDDEPSLIDVVGAVLAEEAIESIFSGDDLSSTSSSEPDFTPDAPDLGDGGGTFGGGGAGDEW